MIGIDSILASTITIAGRRVESEWTWYVIRAAGFTAAGLIVLLILSGIGQVTGFTFRFIEPVKAWIIHKALAIALLFAIAIHISFLLIDHFISFSIFQITIPFLSTYNNKTEFLGLPLGRLGVTFGILAMYGVVILVLTSLFWMERKKRTWRLLHYLSYAVAVLVFFHVLYVGTDVRYGLFRAAWIFLGVIIGIGILMRVRRAGSLKRDKTKDPTA